MNIREIIKDNCFELITLDGHDDNGDTLFVVSREDIGEKTVTERQLIELCSKSYPKL